MAIGLIADPAGVGSGVPVSRNSYRFSEAVTPPTASRSRFAEQRHPQVDEREPVERAGPRSSATVAAGSAWAGAMSAFPPSSSNESLRDRVLDEILEERVVSSRGQKKPRGVKRKMSNYPLRAPAAVSRRKWDWTPHIVSAAR